MGYFKVTGGVATPFLQNEEEFWYKIDGKNVTIEEYWKYENVPGSMEGGGKTTNNPDVYGRKCGGSPSKPKICPKK